MWPAISHNRKSLQRTSEPAAKVISVSDLKTYLKIDGSDEDTILGYLIEAATDLAEIYTRRAFITQTLKLTMDGFDGFNVEDTLQAGVHNMPRGNIYSGNYIELMRLPVQSVTSITTYDTANSSSVFSSAKYTLDTHGGRIYLDEGEVWPSSLRDKAAVEVIYVAGYGDASTDVPEGINAAVMMQAAAMYECRNTADLTGVVKSLLDAYRLYDDLMA